MKPITQEDFQKRLKDVKKRNEQIEYRRKLREERMKPYGKYKVETSKLLAIYLFALLNAIVIYAMVAMWKFMDLSYLGVLISDIAAQVLIYAIYCTKAFKAKQSEENLNFEKQKFLYESTAELVNKNDEAVG